MGCFCLQSISDSVQLQSARLAHLLFPFPALFPAALETLMLAARTPVPTDRAQLQGSTEHLAKHAVFNIVQNNSQDAYATLTGAQKKTPSFLKGFPQNQLTTKTETDQDVLPLFSFLSIFLPFTSDLVLSWAWFGAHRSLWKYFPLPSKGFGPGPWWGWIHALVTVYIHIRIKI